MAPEVELPDRLDLVLRFKGDRHGVWEALSMYRHRLGRKILTNHTVLPGSHTVIPCQYRVLPIQKYNSALRWASTLALVGEHHNESSNTRNRLLFTVNLISPNLYLCAD